MKQAYALGAGPLIIPERHIALIPVTVLYLTCVISMYSIMLSFVKMPHARYTLR